MHYVKLFRTIPSKTLLCCGINLQTGLRGAIDNIEEMHFLLRAMVYMRCGRDTC